MPEATLAYINTAHGFSQSYESRHSSQSVIHFNSIQRFLHTRACNSYLIHTVNSQSDLVVKYTCFTKNTHPLFQPLSDGSKRPDEETTGTDITYTALCPYNKQNACDTLICIDFSSDCIENSSLLVECCAFFTILGIS